MHNNATQNFCGNAYFDDGCSHKSDSVFNTCLPCGMCNGSVCPCTQTKEYYVCKYGQTVYLQDHTTRTLSLANPPILTTPLGTPTPCPRYMKPCPFCGHATSTATSTGPCISYAVTINARMAPLRQEPAQHHTRYPTLAPSSASAVPCWQQFLTGLDSIVF